MRIGMIAAAKRIGIEDVLLDLELRRAEIDEQAVLAARGSQIAKNLRDVGVGDVPCCLDFND